MLSDKRSKEVRMIEESDRSRTANAASELNTASHLFYLSFFASAEELK